MINHANWGSTCTYYISACFLKAPYCALCWVDIALFGLEIIFSKMLEKFVGVFRNGSLCNLLRYLGIADGLSSSGAFATILEGKTAKIFAPFFTCIKLSVFTLPITEH